MSDPLRVAVGEFAREAPGVGGWLRLDAPEARTDTAGFWACAECEVNAKPDFSLYGVDGIEFQGDRLSLLPVEPADLGGSAAATTRRVEPPAGEEMVLARLAELPPKAETETDDEGGEMLEC